MKIPSFFMPPDGKLKNELSKMQELSQRYKEIFGTDPMTEPSWYSEDEWIDILTECIENKITTWEYFGEEYDPEADY